MLLLLPRVRTAVLFLVPWSDIGGLASRSFAALASPVGRCHGVAALVFAFCQHNRLILSSGLLLKQNRILPNPPDALLWQPRSIFSLADLVFRSQVSPPVLAMAGSVNKRKQAPTTPTRARVRRRVGSDDEDSNCGGSSSVVIPVPTGRVTAFSQQKDKVTLRGTQLLSQLKDKFSLEEARQVITAFLYSSYGPPNRWCSSFLTIRLALSCLTTWVMTVFWRRGQ